MKITRTVTYAVQALLQLSSSPNDVPVPCGRLAADGQMPERFLLQILRDLVRHDILRSLRGVEGGYLLAKKPVEITLLDIFEALDMPLIPSVPPLDGLPDLTRQKLLAVLNRVTSAAHREFSTTTLADLVAGVEFNPEAGELPEGTELSEELESDEEAR